MKYKVGDKVRVRKDLNLASVYGKCLATSDMLGYRGKVVTIAAVLHDGYRVEEDCETRYWTDKMFEPACIEKIIITADGVTTTARKYDGKNIIKEAKAVCSKDDEFNFDVGAKLAMERLLEEKPKLYNGKVVCVSSGLYSVGYTNGKIYQFKNGYTVDDDGTTRPTCCIPIESFEGLERKYPGVWLEVVE